MKTIQNNISYLKNIKTNQILNRFISKIKKPLSYHLSKNRNFIDLSSSKDLFILDDEVVNCIDITNKRFMFLNQEKSFGKSIIWSKNDMTDLWNFNLNYFDFLTYLSREYEDKNDIESIKFGKRTIFEWIGSSKRYDRIMWSPYTVSLRLINWYKFVKFCLKNNLINNDEVKLINISISSQVYYLRNNLERDVKGNHLFENLKTLIFFSLITDKLNRKNLFHKLEKQLKEQILDDGCHFEKSFSYHIIILNGLLDMVLGLNKNEIRYPEIFNTYLVKMYLFYKDYIENNDTYPLYNDSNYSMTSALTKIDSKYLLLKLNYSIGSSIDDNEQMKKKSGYLLYKDENIKLVFDAGNLGPKYLMAHSHNDILSFTLDINQEQFIVDSGVSEYSWSKIRKYSKSTKAHNTVYVEDMEQSEIISSFRIGRRSEVTKDFKSVTNNFTHLYGRYRHFLKKNQNYIHHRHIFLSKYNSIIVIDKVVTDYSFKRRLTSLIHFHPKLEIIKTKDMKLSIFLDESTVFINKLNECDSIDVCKSIYMPEFGKEFENDCVQVTSKLNSKYFGYTISKNIDFQANLSKDIINIIENGESFKIKLGEIE